jgi:hypothetical protein
VDHAVGIDREKTLIDELLDAVRDGRRDDRF